eukprot:Rhum_TRINITY_DN12401_c4_g1::Rhum_TRINITY_DN12401_c4_g1_i1::g.51825::m.51825
MSLTSRVGSGVATPTTTKDGACRGPSLPRRPHRPRLPHRSLLALSRTTTGLRQVRQPAEAAPSRGSRRTPGMTTPTKNGAPRKRPPGRSSRRLGNSRSSSSSRSTLRRKLNSGSGNRRRRERRQQRQQLQRNRPSRTAKAIGMVGAATVSRPAAKGEAREAGSGLRRLRRRPSTQSRPARAVRATRVLGMEARAGAPREGARPSLCTKTRGRIPQAPPRRQRRVAARLGRLHTTGRLDGVESPSAERGSASLTEGSSFSACSQLLHKARSSFLVPPPSLLPFLSFFLGGREGGWVLLSFSFFLLAFVPSILFSAETP